VRNLLNQLSAGLSLRRDHLKVLFQGKPLSGADVERGDTVTVVPETRDAVEDHVARSTAVNNFGRACRTKGVTKPILHIGAVLDV
jgi:hypothetical protein